MNLRCDPGDPELSSRLAALFAALAGRSARLVIVAGESQRVFDGRVLQPTLHDEPPVPYNVLVKELGFVSPAQASNALITANRTFARVLRSVIGDYEADPADVEAELDDLRRILAQQKGSLGAGPRSARGTRE